MTRFIILVAALISMASAASLDWRIVGGSVAKPGQFPYQISMRMYGSHSCGGSILNGNWVLTAAHCVYGSSASVMTVVSSTNKLSTGGDTYKVKRYIQHENYNPQILVNDVALLQIDGDIRMSATVQPIALNTENIGAGAKLVLSGWGLTSYPGSIPNDLLFIDLISITSTECNQRHVSTGLTVNENQLCTFTQRGQGACQGDSGGPLAYNGKVAGIVSWGRPCAVGFPDVFTRVSAFNRWITANMVA